MNFGTILTKIVGILLILSSCKNIYQDFQEVKDIASIEAMISFINDHPDNELVDSAKLYLKKYKEELINNEKCYMTTVTNFDEYDRVSDIVIRNIKGADIARVIYEYNSYNLMQYVAAQIIDKSNEDALHTIHYDVYENPKNEDVLCFDYDGNILWRNGNIVVTSNICTNQRSYSEYQYQGSHVTEITTKIYPYLECSDILNIPECFFVL